MQLKVRSTVLRPARSLHHFAWVAGQAYVPAILALSEASFLSLVGVSLVVWSTPLATYSVPRSSDIELLVLSLFLLLHYLSVLRG